MLMINRLRITSGDIEPMRPNSKVWAIADGILAIMPTVMINDEPLPTPRDVICSPSQTINIVPPVNEIIVEKINVYGAMTTALEPSPLARLISPTAMPYP